ncbi:hypothetical protein B0H21DRAFT_706250 [Amylocystis lapponica]|nr:hypothetical protein B0H21DRAFT_706250 [Amylocystis lapponica]
MNVFHDSTIAYDAVRRSIETNGAEVSMHDALVVFGRPQNLQNYWMARDWPVTVFRIPILSQSDRENKPVLGNIPSLNIRKNSSNIGPFPGDKPRHVDEQILHDGVHEQRRVGPPRDQTAVQRPATAVTSADADASWAAGLPANAAGCNGCAIAESLACAGRVCGTGDGEDSHAEQLEAASWLVEVDCHAAPVREWHWAVCMRCWRAGSEHGMRENSQGVRGPMEGWLNSANGENGRWANSKMWPPTDLSRTLFSLHPSCWLSLVCNIFMPLAERKLVLVRSSLVGLRTALRAPFDGSQ